LLEKLAEIYSSSGMNFQDSFDKLLPRPWVIDDLDQFKQKWLRKPWKKAVIFVDNSGADVVLGILPFARELLQRGTKVWLLMAQGSFYDVHVVLHVVSLCTQKNILGC
jgi:hypothetical protein